MEEGVRSAKETGEAAFSSNEVRLSMRHWLVVGIILLGLCHFTPNCWDQLESFAPGPDYRLPYPLSHDYWMYNRYCRQVASEHRTLLIGDSVIWGHHVDDEATLSHYLNELAGEGRFANLGVDGIHPAAMAGLIDFHGRPITEKNVILHCNFLWMSSRRHDLQIEKEFTFNHAELVPQFYPQIPCYRESTSRRLGIVIGRRIPFLGWSRHMRIAYFEGDALPQWTIKHPYANPLAAVTLELPAPSEPPRPVPAATSWTEKQLSRFNPDWVDLETSFQWKCFRQSIETMQRRRNRVFVLIGPFNEHMLTEDGLRGYQEIRSDAILWFTANSVAYYAPTVLPSEYYADGSHPLAEGYALLARELFISEALREFAAGQRSGKAS